MSKQGLITRYSNAEQQIRDGKNLIAAGEQSMETLRQWAREDGLVREFRELEQPAPTWVAPQWEATTRVRVLKPCCIASRNPYGESDLYSAGTDAVVEWPLSVVRRLGDRVEPVPADTELCPIQAPFGTPTTA